MFQNQHAIDFVVLAVSFGFAIHGDTHARRLRRLRFCACERMDTVQPMRAGTVTVSHHKADSRIVSCALATYRTAFSKRRKVIWEALHPEEKPKTEVGQIAPPQFSGQLGGARPQKKGFAAATAEATIALDKKRYSDSLCHTGNTERPNRQFSHSEI